MKLGTLAGALAIAATLALAGCASTPTAPDAEPEATPEQLATVIAAHEPEWRAIIDDVTACRAEFFTGKQVVTCWHDENDAVAEMGAAAATLAKMNSPESMKDLVRSTVTALQNAAIYDGSSCGDEGLPNLDSQKCIDDLGARGRILNGEVTETLNSWSPYL